MKQQTDQAKYIEPRGFGGTSGTWEYNPFEKKYGNVSYKISNHYTNIAITEMVNSIPASMEELSNAKLLSQSKELAKALQEIMKEFNIEKIALRAGSEHPRVKAFENAKQVLKEAGLNGK